MKGAEKEQQRHLYEFGPFRFDISERRLLRDQKPVPLPPKALDTLLALTARHGRLVAKDELMQVVWPDAFVEENNLNQNVSVLRKALGDGPDGQRYIETVPKRGYRFVAPVNERWEKPSDHASEGGLTADHARDDRGSSTCGRIAETAGETHASTEASTPTNGRKPLIAAACALLAATCTAVSLHWFAGEPAHPSPAGAYSSIAVLPFKLLSDRADDDYLGLGMADTLITRLGKIKQVAVRPTSAVRKYDDGEQGALTAARELAVDAALEGTIRRSADRVRVTVRLVSARDGSVLWAGKFDERFTDMFRVEDSISEAVARSFTPALTSEETRRLARRHTEHPEAYRSYMIGRYNWSLANADAWRKAIEYFRAAIATDPNYALAYTGLADTYVSLAASALPQTEAMPRAKEAALRALAIDDTLAEVHIALGKVKQFFDWDWPGAEREFLRALELSPRSADAHREYGAYLATVGRDDQSIAEMQVAREIDPMSLLTNFNVGWALLGARRYDEAIQEFRKVLEMDDSYAAAHRFLGVAYSRKGMYTEAIAQLQHAASLPGENLAAKADLGYAYAVSGRRSEALRVAAELEQLAARRYVSPYFIAVVHAGLGDSNQAFAWLERAYEERSRRLSGLTRNAVWDNIRSDPRYARLLARLNLSR